MRRWILAAALGLAAAPVAAQVSLDATHPQAIAGILSWKGEEQATGYRTREKIFKTQIIKRGSHVHPLPIAAKPIDPEEPQHRARIGRMADLLDQALAPQDNLF